MILIKKNSLSKDIILNLIGSLTYLLSHWIINIVVVNLSGYEDAGILSLASSQAAIFATIALFSVRNFQVSDINNIYSNRIYIIHRIFTCSLSALLLLGYLVLNNNTNQFNLPILLYTLFRISEAFLEVYSGINQVNHRLSKVSLSFMLRGILGLISFSIILKLSLNLNLSILSLLIVTLVVGLWEIIGVKKYAKVKINFSLNDMEQIYSLTKQTVLLFISVLFSSAIFIYPKNIIENLMGSYYLGIFSSISTITIVVQAFINLVFQPLIPTLAKKFTENKTKEIKGLVLIFFAILIIIGVVGVIFSHFLGDFILSNLFNEDILPYAFLLPQIIITILFNAASKILAMILTVMRRIKMLVVIEIIGFLICFLSTNFLVNKFGLVGANLATLIPLIFQFTLLTIYFLKTIRSSDE